MLYVTKMSQCSVNVLCDVILSYLTINKVLFDLWVIINHDFSQNEKLRYKNNTGVKHNSMFSSCYISRTKILCDLMPCFVKFV